MYYVQLKRQKAQGIIEIQETLSLADRLDYQPYNKIISENLPYAKNLVIDALHVLSHLMEKSQSW